MIIAGIGGFKHDYNVALLDLAAGIVSSAEEERFTGVKHHVLSEKNLTTYALEHCLRVIHKNIEDVDRLIFAGTTDFPAKNRVLQLFPRAKAGSIEHHLCHLAGAFFSSGFERALILSLDGFGDGSSGCLAVGDGNRLEVLTYLPESDSLGLEYLRVTSHLGLGGYGAEGKTMGLAPFGEPAFLNQYLEHLDLLPDGRYRLKQPLCFHSGFAFNMDYQDVVHSNSDFLHKICRRRSAEQALEQIHKDLGASVQAFLEKTVMHILTHFKKQTGLDNLCLTGGVAMNSTMNGLIERSGLFDKCFFLPIASDRGLGLGAALYTAHAEMGLSRFFEMKHVYFGSRFSETQIEQELKAYGCSFEKVGDSAEYAAEMLGQGKVIGWFQGRSEIGARALGNRSILADPRLAQMHDYINATVKHRESFRPFAPSVLAEYAQDFFLENLDAPFMMTTSFVRPERQPEIPAVIHVDGTARLQTVDRETNPGYYRLIDKFRQKTGIPMILNTSFNDRGRPIVETIEDALESLELCRLEALILGDYVVHTTEKKASAFQKKQIPDQSMK